MQVNSSAQSRLFSPLHVCYYDNQYYTIKQNGGREGVGCTSRSAQMAELKTDVAESTGVSSSV